MKFLRTDIVNFLTIGKGTVNLKDRGLVLIQGKNEDDTSASSNGSGKSSVVDAICWALYGVTARDVSGDAVVNRHAKKGTEVGVVIEDGPFTYTIIRTRKPNSLVVLVEDGTGNPPVTLTKGTERETQEVINKLMGCSREVFMASIYAGQERMPDLPGMTDKTLKALLEEAAGTEVLAQAYQLAKDGVVAVSRELNDAEVDVLKANMQLDALEINAKDAGLLQLRWEGQRRTDLDALVAAAKGGGETLKMAIVDLTKFDLVGLEAEEKRLRVLMGGFDAEAKQLASFQAALNTAQNAYVAAQTRLQMATKAAAAQTAAVADVRAGIGKACGGCGKPLEAHDMATAINHAVKAAKEATEAQTKADGEVMAARAAVHVAQSNFDTYKASMANPAAVAAELAHVVADIGKANMTRSFIESLDKNVKTRVNEIRALQAKVNPHTATITEIGAKTIALTAQRDAAKKKVEELKVNLKISEDAAAVFSPGGVRAHVLDTITPFLNARTAEYLGALSDGNITAIWTTLSKTAKGEIREKFAIEVTHAEGGDSFASLSGGEKRKVRIACAMALQDLVATRATKPISLFIADEVDHALDEPGLERLMGILEKKAAGVGTVLVISHNSLADWIDTVITVTKESKISRIEGDA